MSSIAVTCGLIILVLLVIMLLAGVPIAVALAVIFKGHVTNLVNTLMLSITGSATNAVK